MANLSPRHFSRAFRAGTGHSPAKAIEKLRVEATRALVDTGFVDAERLRRAFLRAYGEPPQALKRAARARAEEEAVAY